MSVFFYLLAFAINLWHRKFVTADVAALFSTINMLYNNENKILIKIHKYTQHAQLHA